MSPGFLRRAAPLLALLLPLVAAGETYKVEVRPVLNDLDVKIETVEMAGMLVVKLTNKTAGKIRCDLRYDAAPQPLYRTSTYVGPGKTEQSTFRAKSQWFNVVVDVDCKPSDK